MSEIIIEKMKPEDIPFVELLEKQLFSDSWSDKGILGTLEQATAACFLAKQDGKDCGYLLGYWAADECEIARIGVKKSFRRQGVATALIRALAQFGLANACTGIFLDVRESNHAARCFYKACGFREDGIRKHFYKDPGESAVLMSCALETSSVSQ